MSVAALEVLELHHVLATGGRENLAVRFFDRAEEIVDVPWSIAVGGDFEFPETTGPPKGAVHPHRSLLGVLPSHVLQARTWRSGGRPGVQPAEWSWIGPLYQGVLASLYYGTPVLGDANSQFDPERTFELIDRHGVSFIEGATTVYRMMMQVPEPERYDLSSLRVVLGAGETLGQSVVDWWRETVDGVAVHEAYGQTEAGILCGDCEALGVPHEPGRMGKPLPGMEARVIDPETREPVEHGAVGELATRYEGESGVLRGVLERAGEDCPEDPGRLAAHRGHGIADRERLPLLSQPHGRRHRLLGLPDRPAEIEECLAGHEAVANAGVIGVPDETRGEIPKAFVQLAADVEPSADLEATLTDHVRSRLAKYEYPRTMAFVDELPLTTTGKVRRHDLRKREGLVE